MRSKEISLEVNGVETKYILTSHQRVAVPVTISRLMILWNRGKVQMFGKDTNKPQLRAWRN